MAAVKRAPSFDPPPPTGEIRPGLFARFPEGYSCWRRWPLLVVLHGQYREPAYDFGIWGPLADAAGMILICPIYGTTGGTTRSPQADAAVLDEVAAMILRHNVDPDRVYLSGISMGGAMTWRLGQAYPDRWAALGPEIHGPKAFADGYPFLGNVADVPLFVMEGEFDGLNTVYNRRAAKELRAAGGPFEYHELRNFGHDRMTWLYPMFLEFAAARRRDPHPRRIDHAAMNAYEGTRAWLSIRSVSGGAAFGARDGAFNPRDLCRIRADIAESTITLTALAGKPAEVEVFHDPLLMTTPMTIVIGDRKTPWKPVFDAGKLLERVRTTGDRGQLYGGSLRVRW
ncbi:MAG: hypothetical protein HUU15_03035 [Candidatus Brocadiae bacterium]|nr:hypothetical protein [Candidatus Brocadiia bacterium]